MKKLIVPAMIALTVLPLISHSGHVDYDKYFGEKTMRIDYHHVWIGNKEVISLDKIYKEGRWAGSRKILTDPFNYGKYKIKIFTSNGEKLLFSKGFDSYFGEYITTGAATKGVKKAYHESAIIPYPLSKILFKIDKVYPAGNSETLYKKVIDPLSIDILEEKPDSDIKVFTVHKGGDPSVCLDIVVVAEGYTSKQEEKVKNDLEKVKNIFFSQEPYKTNRDKINIFGLFKPSNESGSDEPRIKSYKNTSVDTTFNSLNSARYLLTESNKKLRDITSAAPCDSILIMVNSSRYGGGGIYNGFCAFTIDNAQAPYLLLHEFGHSFGGLADEYYSSSVAYNDFYPKGIEPTEPNITSLSDHKGPKWDNLIKKNTKIPTLWHKEKFDEMNNEFGKMRKKLNLRIEKIKLSGASDKEIKEAESAIEKLMIKKEKENKLFFKKTGKLGVVGAFKGAGYASEGLYRPMIDCIMFTIGKKPYCKICENAILQMVKRYSN